jgi:RND family efflux transporter MFP subunit
MATEMELESGRSTENGRELPAWLSRPKALLAGGLSLIALVTLCLLLPIGRSQSADATLLPPPQVAVSKPLTRELDTRVGFLGQFSAVDEVELRAQVGGTLTDIHFKDGDIVRKGDLLFTIDTVPYQIEFDRARARLEIAKARLALADSELARAQELKRAKAVSNEEVDRRNSEQLSARAAVDDAAAQIRDARFDLDHCRIVAPFTGRIGKHLVSVGNLIAGSRAASSPTTLLATLVSLEPIHLDFDMSESDFQIFSQYRAVQKGRATDKVEIALSDETKFARLGFLDFVNNVLDRSSGTIHARATVPNPGLALTPGQFARVRLVVAAPAPTLLVPDPAVLPDQSRHIVMTVSADGTVAPALVEIGDTRGGLRVIRAGITPDTRVIVDGLPFAAPGSKVTAQDTTIRFAAEEN